MGALRDEAGMGVRKIDGVVIQDDGRDYEP